MEAGRTGGIREYAGGLVSPRRPPESGGGSRSGVEYRGMGRPLDIRRAKRIVARDEAVVYYFLTDPETYNEYHIDIFVITKRKIS